MGKEEKAENTQLGTTMKRLKAKVRKKGREQICEGRILPKLPPKDKKGGTECASSLQRGRRRGIHPVLADGNFSCATGKFRRGGQ